MRAKSKIAVITIVLAVAGSIGWCKYSEHREYLGLLSELPSVEDSPKMCGIRLRTKIDVGNKDELRKYGIMEVRDVGRAWECVFLPANAKVDRKYELLIGKRTKEVLQIEMAWDIEKPETDALIKMIVDEWRNLAKEAGTVIQVVERLNNTNSFIAHCGQFENDEKLECGAYVNKDGIVTGARASLSASWQLWDFEGLR